ncbi:hypothetical protein glysoja_030325 [Glycine soja]|uniref:Uncharacterized protein n=1 Tax=Glycine soja TaxID=3848 RepID=A0A0B2PFF8_GLYSO|nr:hypothetical protein glysoja_030325 [Glycine soja]
MGIKVMQLSQPVLPHSPSSSHTLASAIFSPSSSKTRTLVCRFVHRSSLFPTTTTRLLRRTKSFEQHALFTRRGNIRRACSASLEPFSDEEFAKKIEDLALKFQLSDDATTNANDLESEDFQEISSTVNFAEEFEPPEEIIPANIERKANSVELPFSLRIIKKKLQWKEGFREAGESAYCSVKKAFSSMVFIIRELHSFTLQMREVLFYEDLQGILERVQNEMHASFVWLFQQVFSHTPTLMVYVMILLANFTVYSMGNNAAIAGGGGKVRPAANGTDGDGRFDRSRHGTVFSDGGASTQAYKTGEKTESVSGQEEEEEENLWNAMVEEASRMEVSWRGKDLDSDVMKRFVSPVMASIESDDYAEYLRTELVYQTGLSQDPNNTLLLANYAQFLYLVAHDYDRAEEFFKRAIEVEPPDAEAYNKYATFLWKVKNDLWAAEETYLEAISADPNNSFYAANYAHFLWNTGGEDTCFPLSSPDNSQEV